MNLVTFGVVFVAASIGTAQIPTTATPTVLVSTKAEPVADGKFKPSWESLKQFQVPECFGTPSSAFGALGSAMRTERGDWYARMYSRETTVPRHLKLYAPVHEGFKE